MHNTDALVGFQSPEVIVTGDDQVSFAGHGAFQNTVIIFIFHDHLEGGHWHDNLCYFGQQFQTGTDAAIIPAELQPQYIADFVDNSRGNETLVAALESLAPKLKKPALRMGEG